MSLGGVVTYAFNPILLQPAMAWLLWTNLGLLAGLALRVAEQDPLGAARFAIPGAGLPAFGLGQATLHGRSAARRNT